MSQFDTKSIQTPAVGVVGFESDSYFGRLKKTLCLSLRRDTFLYVFIACYFLFGFIYLNLVGQAQESHFFIYFSVLLPLFLVFFTPFIALYSVLVIQRRAPTRQRLAFKAIVNPNNMTRYICGLTFLTAYCLFIGMFTGVKSSLGNIFGFQHDIYQADIDKFLFFGVDAWRVLFTPIHSTWLQPIIEFNYNAIWHLQTYLVLYLVATAYQSRQFRKRYLLSFMLVWVVVGNIAAGIFISAGPAFYGNLTGDELRFGEQLQMLSTFKASSAIHFQDYLWTSYVTNSPGFGTGISAFPSVHVSLSILNVFFAFEFSRRLGFVALVYAVIIWISSVYLAWHYFIDGLFGAVLVAGIYYGTRYFLNGTKG